jgi:hypothetical protein
MVVEKYDISNSSGFVRMYLQFSMADTVQLHGEPLKTVRATCTNVIKQKSTKGNPFCPTPLLEWTSSSVKSSKSVTSPLTADASNLDRRGMNDSERNSVSGFKGLDKLCTCFVSRVFVVDYCEPITLRSKIPSQISLCFTANGWFIGPSRVVTCGCSPCMSSEPHDSNSNRPFVPVTVIFRDTCVKWSPTLHPGCIYRFSKLRCCKPDALGAMSGFPGKARSITNMRLLISLDEDVELERLYLPDVDSVETLSAVQRDALNKLINQVCQRLEECSFALQSNRPLTSNSGDR